MANLLSQNSVASQRGEHSVLATLVELVAASDSFDLPNMAAASNSVVQLRRPGDTAVSVTQTDANTVSITGGSAGQRVLLVSSHNDPILNGPVPGTAEIGSS